MAWVLTGLLVGFVGALVGAGGGFLLMPVLLLAYRLPPAQAAAVSLVTVAAASLAGTLTYVRQGLVDVGTGLSLAVFAVPGSLVGARLAAVLPAQDLSLGFGLLLASLGLWMALGRAPVRSDWRPVRPRGMVGMNTLAPVHAGMVVVGGLAALFGIGGGPLMVPLLAFGRGMDVHRAAATAQVIILLTALAGVAGYAAGGGVAWGPAGALALGAVAGAPLGASLAGRLPARRLLQLLGLCLLGVGGRLMFG